VTLATRQAFAQRLIQGLRIAGFRVMFNTINYVAQLSDPFDLDILIEDITQHIFSNPLTENQINGLKDILENWRNEYGEYIAEPNGTPRKEELESAISNKLQTLFETLLNMPEYYLS